VLRILKSRGMYQRDAWVCWGLMLRLLRVRRFLIQEFFLVEHVA